MIDGLPGALEHLRELEGRVAGRRPAVFLDYDGTLTAIVPDPARARLPDRTRVAIRRLAAVAPVAIVSGRDLEDVRRLVALEGLWYAGSHGFEILGPDGSRHERAPGTLPVLDKVEAALGEAIGSVSGARVERKRFAIAVHVRNVVEAQVPAVDAAVAAVAAVHPDLRRTGGKKVFELRPNLDWDKGRAVGWLLEELGLERPDIVPIYVGDDETDEDAFRALAGKGIGIVVRGEGDHRPTAAALALESPDDVPRLLDAIRRTVDGPPASGPAPR
jgi:trehalose-phosphatase